MHSAHERLKSSVVLDPDQMNPEPDPECQVNKDPDPGFWWPKIERKKYTRKIIFFVI